MNEPHFRLLPEPASSTIAYQVDWVTYFLLGVSLFFTILIFALLIYFAIKYRRRTEDEVPPQVMGSLKLEITWTVVPLAITMVMFVWGAKVFFDAHKPPPGAMEIHVVGKQWMWKFQHPGGQREINELHLPLGKPVKLLLTSEDVIHDLFIPAFRVKTDVLPGRYTVEWFEPTRAGQYHLFCSQYCGTNHSGMIGRVVVMEQPDFDRWLSGQVSGGTLASQGEQLFRHYGCAGCHRDDSLARAPNLVGLYLRPVNLSDGRTVIADDDYLRESILDSQAKIVAGWQPIMPIFRGVIGESEVVELIAYIKSLGGGREAEAQTKR